MFLRRRREAAAGSSVGTRPLRRAASVDGVKDEADDLGGDEEDLRAARKANKEIDATEDAPEPEQRGQRRPELALGLGLAAAKHEHRRAHRDKGGERPGIGESGDA